MRLGKPVLQIADRIHAQPTLLERLLPTLLVRLIMVGLTMAVTCWIGWSVPASHDAEPIHAAVDLAGERASSGPLLPKESQATVDLSAERPKTKSSGQAARTTLDVNQATAQELEQLPGIGPVLAGRIVEFRNSRGGFTNVDQLRRVKGIGGKTFERIRAFIAVVPPVSISARTAA
jgi:competence protein ComEA